MSYFSQTQTRIEKDKYELLVLKYKIEVVGLDQSLLIAWGMP